MSTQNNRKS